MCGITHQQVQQLSKSLYFTFNLFLCSYMVVCSGTVPKTHLFLTLLLIKSIALILKIMHSSGGGGILSYVAIECIIPQWNLLASLLFVLFIPLFGFLLALLSYLVSIILSCIPPFPRFDSEIRKLYIWKFVVVFVTLQYFDVATLIFKMFSCSSFDEWTHKYYLTAYPSFTHG